MSVLFLLAQRSKYMFIIWLIALLFLMYCEKKKEKADHNKITFLEHIQYLFHKLIMFLCKIVS